MSIVRDGKTLWGAYNLYKQIKEGKLDFKSVAGWVKIIGYVFAALGLIVGYLEPKTVIAFTLVLSAAVKLAEAIASLTKTTNDDIIVKAVKDEATEHGLLK